MLSIEKDAHAHRTLTLREFFREFPQGQVPDDYYAYLAGRISRSDLFSSHREAYQNAAIQAWLAELGGKTTSDKEIDVRIRVALGGRKNWILIGGPPCQAYSLVGRSRVIGGEGLRKYEADLTCPPLMYHPV